MVRFPAPLAQVVERQHGTVTASQLHRHGIDPFDVDRLRDRGLLSLTHPDVYCLGDARQIGFEAACVAACLAHPRGLIGGAAAAALWNFDHLFRPLHPEFLHVITQPPTPRMRAVSYRPCEHVDVLHSVSRTDGIRLLDRAETWLDCVAHLSDQRATTFTDHVLTTHCAADELAAAVDRWEARRRRRPPGRTRRLLTALTA